MSVMFRTGGGDMLSVLILTSSGGDKSIFRRKYEKYLFMEFLFVVEHQMYGGKPEGVEVEQSPVHSPDSGSDNGAVKQSVIRSRRKRTQLLNRR